MRKCKKCEIKKFCKNYNDYLLLIYKKEKIIDKIKNKQKELKTCNGVMY